MTLLDTFRQLAAGLDAAVLGQKYLTERLLIGLLADGHLLLEEVRKLGVGALRFLRR